jgi:REP-associated tyrosine transposase
MMEKPSDTSASQPLPFHLFDSSADTLVVERRLPHWSQAGAVCFITWRTHDSLPKTVLDRWFDDRDRWLRAQAVDPDKPDWRQALRQLDRGIVQKFLSVFWNRWHDALDECQGACVLRQPELAGIIADSLHYFDGQRYLLLDFVVMPNHVHLLAAFPEEKAMLSQCESWKHYTATQINRHLRQKDRFWQQDGFDHLVRSEDQFQYLRRYIAVNPDRAGLRPGDVIHFTRQL